MKDAPESPALSKAPTEAPAEASVLSRLTPTLAETPEVKPGATETPAAPTLTPEPVQETDAWWGSYSGWTMMPSMAVCVGLTGLIAWASWRFLDKGWVQLSFLSLTGALWLLQAIRWCYRVFGYNYRATTQRLFETRGLLYQDALEVPLTEVTKVSVHRGPFDMMVGVGDVCLLREGPRNIVILEGVRRPRPVADLLRQLSEKARESQVTGTKA